MWKHKHKFWYIFVVVCGKIRHSSELKLKPHTILLQNLWDVPNSQKLAPIHQAALLVRPTQLFFDGNDDTYAKKRRPGNSAGDFFGMFKWLFQRLLVTSNDWVEKRHGLNHLGDEVLLNLTSPSFRRGCNIVGMYDLTPAVVGLRKHIFLGWWYCSNRGEVLRY